MSSKLKNSIIVLLGLLALYQTTKLWFENISNRNFFYSFFTADAYVERDAELLKNLVRPYRLITNLGNQKFYVDYAGRSGSCDQAIADAIAQGGFVGESEADWEELLGGRSVIYEYAAALPSSSFAEGFSENSSAFTSRVKSIDTVLIQPGSGGETRLFFLNRVQGRAYEYVLPSSSGQRVQQYITERQNEAADLYYISSTQYYSSELFENNIFIPAWDSAAPYMYNPVNLVNPYTEGGQEALMYQLEPFINEFFKNPALRNEPYSRTTVDAGTGRESSVYIYSCETAQIEYYPNLVLEYSDYGVLEPSVSENFSQAYIQAMNFLQRDSTLDIDQIYLSGYSFDDTEGYSFSFDYLVNNRPVILTENYRQTTGLTHAIEMLVHNDTVTNYSRFVCRFEQNEDVLLNADKDYLSVINALIDENSENFREGLSINNIDIGYNLEWDRMMTLSWFILSDTVYYLRPVI